MSKKKLRRRVSRKKKSSARLILNPIFLSTLVLLLVVAVVIIGASFMKQSSSTQSASVSIDLPPPASYSKSTNKMNKKLAVGVPKKEKSVSPIKKTLSIKTKQMVEASIEIWRKKQTPTPRKVTLTYKSDPSHWYWPNCSKGNYHSVDIVSKGGRRKSGWVCYYFGISKSSFD